MQKKKSVKKINKTFNSSTSKKQQSISIGVNDIMKEIGQLKKQLVSIKSKKYLHIKQKDKDQQYLANMTGNTKRQGEETLDKNKVKIKHFQTFNSQAKQNIENQQCICDHAQTVQNKKNRKSRQSLKIQLLHLSSPKSRSIKLKVNIQLNKIKSILQKFLLNIEQPQPIQLLVAQLNTTIAYIDNSFNQYQYQLANKKTEFKFMKSELSQISQNVIKLAQKYSSQKNMSSLQVQEIAELKRYISYYLHIMKDSKEQAQKYSKQVSDLQDYIKQLQNNNNTLRKQIKQQKQSSQRIEKIHKQLQASLQKKIKQFALIQQDMQALRIESQKNRDKRKQLQKKNEKISEQMKQMQQKYHFKQYQLTKLQQTNRQLIQDLEKLKEQFNEEELKFVNKNIQIQRLERQLSILRVTYQNKQKIIIQQDEQLIILRERLQKQTKDNKKLTQNLQFSQRQIDNLSQQIDSLKQANQRYKNKHFRNKLIQGQTHQKVKQQDSSNQSTPLQNKSQSHQEHSRRSQHSHKKNRQKILGEIQELIQKHKRQSDSYQSDNQQY